jgi:hypothetical protein
MLADVALSLRHQLRYRFACFADVADGPQEDVHGDSRAFGRRRQLLGSLGDLLGAARTFADLSADLFYRLRDRRRR